MAGMRRRGSWNNNRGAAEVVFLKFIHAGLKQTSQIWNSAHVTPSSKLVSM